MWWSGTRSRDDGFTAEGGVETLTYGLKLSPPLRYTRWAGDAPLYPGIPGYHFNYLQTRANAVDRPGEFRFNLLTR